MDPATAVLIWRQRLKGAIDSRIAEEQARQRTSQQSPSRSNSNARRPSIRASSPTKRVTRRKDEDPSPKDPSEFEPDFGIENEDGSGNSGIPRLSQKKEGVIGASEVPREAHPSAMNRSEGDRASIVDTATSLDLPADIRTKLRRLDKLESRYHGSSSAGITLDEAENLQIC